MGALRDRMAANLRLRNLRPSTRESYLTCVRKFAAYHRRSPAELGETEVRDFLVHLRDRLTHHVHILVAERRELSSRPQQESPASCIRSGMLKRPRATPPHLLGGLVFLRHRGLLLLRP